MVRILDLRAASRGFKSQKRSFRFLYPEAICARVLVPKKSMGESNLNSLLTSNKVSLSTGEINNVEYKHLELKHPF